MENEISITVVATGFSQPNESKLIGNSTGAVDLGALYRNPGTKETQAENPQDVSRFWRK
jgi:hypothetical protein